MRYGFVDKQGHRYECDDCDLKKFKFWFGLVKGQMKFGFAELDNGDKWIYYYGRYHWRWEKVYSAEKMGQIELNFF